MSFTKILNHPDRNEITSKLASGESGRDVANWLKAKYSNDKDKQISYSLLNDFRKEHLNVHGAVLNDLQNSLSEAEKEEESKQADKLAKKNSVYKQKLQEVVDTQIDWRFKLLQLLNVVETRVQQVFDRIQEYPDSSKADYVLIQWMTTILDIIERIRKIEGAPDQIIQHNVAIQSVEEQSAIIQEAVRQTFAEVDLETSLLLMEKLAANMERIKAQRNQYSFTEKNINKISSSLNELSGAIIPYKKKDDDE